MWSLLLIGLLVSGSLSIPLDLESRLVDLERKFEQQQLENRRLQEELTVIRNSNRRLPLYPSLLEDGSTDDSHNTDKRLLQQATLPVDGIGFYAYMSTDEPDPRGHHTLVYDVIQTNLGQGYNKNTGVFTVPKACLYSLTWSTRVSCHLAHTTELVINDRILGSTYAYCGYNTVTGHVVATVSQGDVIFVRTHSTSPG